MTSSVSVFCDIVHLQNLITPLWFCIWQDQQTAVVRCLPKISLHCTSWRHFSVRRISTVTSFRKAFIAWLLHHFYMVEWFYLLNAFCGKTAGTLRRKILQKEVFRRWNLKNSWFTHRKSLLEMTSKLELNAYVKKEQNQAWSILKRTWKKIYFSITSTRMRDIATIFTSGASSFPSPQHLSVFHIITPVKPV